MDINMKEILLSKEKDGWVYINEIIKGVKTPTTKLLVDDGTKSLAQYQAEVKN